MSFHGKFSAMMVLSHSFIGYLFWVTNLLDDNCHMWVLCGCWVTVCLLWCCLLCCAAAVSLIRTAHFQNSAGQRPLDWCASQTPDCMVQVRIIMSMIEILFNMNTEQSVDAGHHTGLLERTGGVCCRVCCRAFVAELLCFVGVYWITGRLLNEIRSWLVPYCVGVEAGEIPVFYVRGLPGKSWPEASVWLREAWINIDWELDSSALGSVVSVPCPLISWGITVSTIQSRASRTITSSYFLWVDLLLVDIIIFSCVGYLLSVCCECIATCGDTGDFSLSVCVIDRPTWAAVVRWWMLTDFACGLWIRRTLGHCRLWFLRQWPTAWFIWTCVVFIF